MSVERRSWPRGAVDADHVRALFQQTPASLTGNLIGMLLVAAIFAPLAPPWRVGAWLAVVFGLWMLRLAHYLRYRSNTDADNTTLLAWRKSWRVLVEF